MNIGARPRLSEVAVIVWSRSKTMMARSDINLNPQTRLVRTSSLIEVVPRHYLRRLCRACEKSTHPANTAQVLKRSKIMSGVNAAGNLVLNWAESLG